MRDEIARAAGRDVSRETMDRLEGYVALLQRAAPKQNLVSASTLDAIWVRHVLDSAQLVRFEPAAGAVWVDIGSGAGLPGLVIAAIVDGPVTLIEPRRLRAEFLREAAVVLGLDHKVSVVASRAESATGCFDVITGRAVAPLDRFLHLARHLSHPDTVWVLPKGRTAQSELAEASRNWHCQVRSEPSCTNPDSQILVLTRVGARKT